MPLLVVTLAALVVRLNQLGAASLSVDEAAGVLLAARPLPDLMQRLVTEDAQSPLYPMLLHFWMAIAGTGEFAVRLTSVVAGTALVPLIYATGEQMEWLARPNERPAISLVGLLSAVLAGSSALYVGHSQEAGGYMAATFAGLLSSYLLLRALAGGGWKGWAGYTGATLVAFYTSSTAFLLPAFHLLYVALVHRSHPRAGRRWALSFGVAVGLYLPWLGYAGDQIDRIGDYWRGSADLGAALRASLLLFTGTGPAGLPATVLPTLVGLGLLVLGFVALLAGAFQSRAGRSALFPLLYLLIPAALLFALVYFRLEFDPRYLLVATPGIYLIMAWGLATLFQAATSTGAPWLLRAVLPCLGIAALAGMVATSALYGDPADVRQVGDGRAGAGRYGDYGALVAYIESHSQPGDAVVLMRNGYQPYEYYRKSAIPWYPMEPGYDMEGATLRLNGMVDDRRVRLWFILWQEEQADPSGYVMHVMEDQSTEVELDASFGGIGLRLFQLTPGRRFSYYPQAANNIDAVAGGLLEFWGWNGSSPRATGGEYVEYDLHWRPFKKVDSNLRARVALVDGAGHVLAQTDEVMGSQVFPTSRWNPRQIVHDRHRLTVPLGTPPGYYAVELRLFDPATLKDVDVTRASGQALGTVLPLGQLEVDATPPEAFEAASAMPGGGPQLPNLGSAVARAFRLGIALFPDLGKAFPQEPRAQPAARWDLGKDRLELLDGRVGQVFIKPGDTQEVTLRWRAPSTPSANYAVRLALLDPKGKLTAEETLPITAGYPTTRWRPGEVVISKYWLPLPITMGADKHWVAVTPVSGGEGTLPTARYAQAAAMEIVEVKANSTLPPMQNRLGMRLEGKAELAGFDLVSTNARPGDTLRLTLYWRTLDGFDRGYKVFNHVIDAQNLFAGQRDAIPVSDTRPTTTWRKGEVLVDRYEIPISREAKPGSYLLRVGMYAQEGGQRLAVGYPSGTPAGDSITLATIEVAP